MKNQKTSALKNQNQNQAPEEQDSNQAPQGQKQNGDPAPKAQSARGQTPKEPESQEDESPLRELLLSELADVYSAEKQLIKALPKLAKAARSEELREAFESHLQETEGQVTRLEEVAEALGETLERKTCKAMQGLVEEGEEMLQEFKASPALDAALVAAAQKVEHYEIASYGTLVAWCRQLGLEDAALILEETLDEEKTADDTLTGIAETLANHEAV